MSFLDRQVLSMLAPRLLQEFGMNNASYGRVVFCFVLSYTVMFSVGGLIMDRLGTRFGLLLAVAVWSFASATHAFSVGPVSLGFSRFLLGAGEGACFPAVTKGAVEWIAVKHRSLAVGFANGGSAFGAVLAPPLTAWWAGVFGWRGAFLATAAAGAVWIVIWFFAIRGVPAGPALRATVSPVQQWSTLARRYWWLLLARFLFDPVFYFYMFWTPQYLSRERGLPLAEIGRLGWIPFFALGITNILAGRVSDIMVRRGYAAKKARLVLMLAAALVTPVACLAAFAPNGLEAILLMSVLTTAHGFWIANFITLIGDLVSLELVATMVGLTGTAGGIGGMIANLAIDYVADHYAFLPVFIVCAFLYPAAWLVIRGGLNKNLLEAGS